MLLLLLLLMLPLLLVFVLLLLQPEGVAAGLGDACRCVSRGFVSARDVCLRLYTANSGGIEVLQIASRLFPSIILRPLLGLSEGCTRAVQVTQTCNEGLGFRV